MQTPAADVDSAANIKNAPLVPPDVARDMAGLLPRADYVELTGCGHLPSMEDPGAFVRAVLGWLPITG